MNTLVNHIYASQRPEQPAASIMDRGRPPITKLKIMLDGRPGDTCPALDQHQIARIPSDFLDILCRDYKTLDYDDFGTVILVSDDKYLTTIVKRVQWIAKGEKASFLFAPKHDVVKKNGDSEYSENLLGAAYDESY